MACVATVVVTRHDEPDTMIAACLEHLAAQRGLALAVCFLDQRGGSAMEALCARRTSERVRFEWHAAPRLALSAARNRGLELAGTDVVAFTDADALPEPAWAATLAGGFARGERVAVVGGRTVAEWPAAPRWWSRTGFAADVYSLRDRGSGAFPDEDVVGVNFALHRGRLGDAARFDLALGRRPGALLGGEEEELCARARARGLEIWYDGGAVVRHHVQRERMRLGWLMRRYYWAGFERAVKGERPRPLRRERGLDDWVLAALVAPPYVAGVAAGRIRTRR